MQTQSKNVTDFFIHVHFIIIHRWVYKKEISLDLDLSLADLSLF